jgi:hypothetical protein
MKTLLILMTLALPACGQDDSGSDKEPAKDDKADEPASVAGDESTKVGPKGDRGEIGPAGPAGKDAVSIPGKDGKDGAPTAVNQWYDPLTGDLWLIGDTVVYADAVCTGDWSLPTETQLTAAKQHGIAFAAAAIDAPVDPWSATNDPNTGLPLVVRVDMVYIGPAPTTELHAFYCVKEFSDAL